VAESFGKYRSLPKTGLYLSSHDSSFSEEKEAKRLLLPALLPSGGAGDPPTAGFEAVTGSRTEVQLLDFNLTREDPMTENNLPLADLLAKAGDPDFLRRAAEIVVQMLFEADLEGKIGAGRHEHSGERVTYRNGYRDRSLDTRLGGLHLRIPKLRQGSDFPPFLEARKTNEKALLAVVQGGLDWRRVHPPRKTWSSPWAFMASAKAPSASSAPISTSACTLSLTWTVVACAAPNLSSSMPKRG
jgi:hypothetical protein